MTAFTFTVRFRHRNEKKEKRDAEENGNQADSGQRMGKLLD